MPRFASLSIVAAACWFAPYQASADTSALSRAPATLPAAEPESFPTPIARFAANLVDAFSGTNLIFYGSAVAVTGVFAYSGMDHAVVVGTQKHLAVPAFSDATVVAGYVLPLVAAPAVYLVGLTVADRSLAGAGAAAVQALTVTLVTTGVLKLLTGRPFPNHGADPKDPDRLNYPSYAYQFSFQVAHPTQMFAWPSGHTSASTSVAAALTGFYADCLWVPFVTYPVALLIGAGMIDGAHHWTSDVIAGGLIGHAIGFSIGRNFRRLVRSAGDAKGPTAWPRWELQPFLAAKMGLSVGGYF